jgi:hypothetical protein
MSCLYIWNKSITKFISLWTFIVFEFMVQMKILHFKYYEMKKWIKLNDDIAEI